MADEKPPLGLLEATMSVDEAICRLLNQSPHESFEEILHWPTTERKVG